MKLWLRSALFTIVVPGAGGVIGPWWVLTHGGPIPRPAAWYPMIVIVLGAALYFRCLSAFAITGGGTPGLWDAPRRVVATGPYRWVRNPIYLGAFLVVGGEAWLFRSGALAVYTIAMVLFCHLFVIGYEETTLRRRFGEAYVLYRRSVPRWIPRPPRDRPHDRDADAVPRT